MIPLLNRTQQVRDVYLHFAADLRLHGFEGEIKDSYSDRTVQSTDNSIYQVLPELVVFPKTTQDLVRVARIASNPRFHALKIYPRGGGTGTNGQSLGDGVVVDLSRHMNRILEINVEERWARVEAGVVKDQLEAALKPFGLFFAPELSTSNRATIGGMINTDASGQGSCVYGKTRDHVLSLSTVLTDGTLWVSEPMGDEQLAVILERQDIVGRVHRTVNGIYKQDADLIHERFPKLTRSLTGYDLAHIRDDCQRFNLNSILCGSEGSLGFIAEAKINLLPIPKHTALIVVSYATFDAALRDAPRLLKLHATSIETVDSTVLKLARQDNAWRNIQHFFPKEDLAIEGVNLVEFTALDRLTLERSLHQAMSLFASVSGVCDVLSHGIADGHAEVECVWDMRKRAVGLLGRLTGEQRPIPFVEDTAVPPEHLADYIAELRSLLDGHGVKYGMFGHADAGVLHVRPAIDMKDPQQEKLIRLITDAVVALTQKYHGVLWGEHGKGLRSEYAPKFFGDLYPRLQEIKSSFDPRNQLNPGKIAVPVGEELLRLDSAPTRGQHDRVIPIAVRNEFADSLHCNGNGACFNFDADDAMCPSWKASRDRRFSPKGRASLLREWLRLITEAGGANLLDAGPPSMVQAICALPRRIRNTLEKRRGEYDFSHEVMDAMHTCLACKSCTGQCPIKVDVPGFRSKFIALYYTRYLRPAKDWGLAQLEPTLPWLSKVPRLYNACATNRGAKFLLRCFNLVEIPSLSTIDPAVEIRRAGFEIASPASIAAVAGAGKRAVVVVQDAFTSYFETQLVLDTFRLLEKMGFTPLLAPYLPNGKTLHVHGFRDKFRNTAKKNTAMLKQLEASGTPLVGIDPAMTLTYRSEYAEVLGGNSAPKVLLLQEWLAGTLSPASTSTPSRDVTYFLLPHCTERTNVPHAMDNWTAVFAALGVKLEVLTSGCCGMSGTYGHEANNRATSEAIYQMSWAPAVEKYKATGRLMATGYSCRSQAKITAGVRLPHPVQALLKIVCYPTTADGYPLTQPESFDSQTGSTSQ